MKFLLKILCLLSFLSSFSFSKEVWVKTDDILDGLTPMKNCEFFLGKSFLKCTNPETGAYKVLRNYFVSDYLYFNPTKSGGYYESGIHGYFIDKVQYSGYFSYVSSYSSYLYSESSAQSGKLFTYTNLIEFRLGDLFAECSVGENLGIKSKKCFPACPAGQSWDYENEVCYSDCSDKNLNKFGYSNGTAQGGCVDCSNAFTDHDIASCICSGFGTTLSEKGTYLSLEGSSFVSYSCANGFDITFKRRSNENADKDKDKKKDNNSTNLSDKDKENPKPDKDKDKKNDNNSTNSSNKDNKKEDTKPNKKDNNENSNNSSGEAGNSSNNNSGGTAGNGSSGGGGTGVETKPNPNSGNGKQDGKGEEGKGDDAEAQKLDYGDLEKDAVKFNGEFKKAVDDSFSFVNDVKASLTDTIQEIKDGNLMSLNKGSISSTCPLNYRINLIYFEKDVSFDICKSISPASQTLYYFFYVVFFVLFLVLIIKLFLFTFMGW